jgi:hypothetical protein
MEMNTLFLACGAMRFTPEQEAFFGGIIFSVLAFWLASAAMAFTSFCFLLNPGLSKVFKIINGSILAACILLVLSLFVRMWMDDLRSALFVGFGIPIIIICQFVFLWQIRRRLRRNYERGLGGA